MASGHVQLPADGAGKNVDAVSLTSSEGGNPTVYRQIVAVGDPATFGNVAAVDASGALGVSTIDGTASGSITTLNSNLSSGAATANSTVVTGVLNGASTGSAQVTGTWTGTLVAQISIDGSNWVTLGLIQNVATNVLSATIVSAATGIWVATIAGAKYFRVTASAAMSGTAVVTVRTVVGEALSGLISNAATGNGVVGTTVQRVAVASDNSPVPSDLQKVNSSTVSVGNGVSGTGVQRVVIASDNTPYRVVVSETLGAPTFSGRATTFRIPGRAGTSGQKIFALHNATGSSKTVLIKAMAVDITCTVIKAVTVLPPVIRIHRFTAVPTNGTTITKVAKNTALTSNASITAWGDASADGTGSGTALTVTIPANSCLAQEFAPRLITAAGYEMFDRTTFFDSTGPIVLGALEGVVVFLDYVLATQNPTTDMWVVSCDWDEY